MSKNYLLLMISLALMLCWPQKSSAIDTLAVHYQDSINARSLIISELMMADRQYNSWVYAEFANTGTTDLDLSHYFTWSTWHNNVWASESEMDPNSNRRITLSGTLAPGDVFLLVRRENNKQEDPYGNLLYPNGYTNCEAEAIADLVRTSQNPVTDKATFGNRSTWAEWRIGLCYINEITEYQDHVWPDSVFIDRFGASNDDLPDGNVDADDLDAYRFPIAGVTSSSPRRAAVYVRKYGVKKGNTVEGQPNDYPTIEWDESRGTDLTDSEWIPLPRSMDTGNDQIFTTMGYHGPSPALDISSTTAIINNTTKTITIPQGTSRDSVFRMFDVGVNHAWELKLGADTGKFFVQEDDSLFFYTAGDQLSVYKFAVKIDKKDDSFAQVAPLVYKNANNAFVRNYDISNGKSPRDTIGTLAYDLPIDTLMAYTVIPSGATWEIIPSDGITRPEVKDGDILKITAMDGNTVKEYRLGVQDFFPNHDADLESIYFPGLDIFENPHTYDATDTLVNFSPSIYFYNIKLDNDIKTSPAIVAHPKNSRSRVEIYRAKDLKGTQEDRTATIIVTAEDDTTISEYNILFTLERETPPVQGSLFITDVATDWAGANTYNVEFYNPSDDFIDLTDYVFVSLTDETGYGSLFSSFANDSNWANNNDKLFRFGSIIEPSENMVPVFKTDLNQRKVLLGPKEEYVMAHKLGYPILYAARPDYHEKAEQVDLIFAGGDANWSGWSTTEGWLVYGPERFGSTDPYDSGFLPLGALTTNFSWWIYNWGAQRFGIARILNDSIKDGIKHVALNQSNFEKDYEWVDVFGGVNYSDASARLYDNDKIIDLTDNVPAPAGMYRKPYVYTGNPVSGMSFGYGDDETQKTIYPSEWEYYGWDAETGAQTPRQEVDKIRDARFATHLMITSAHIPYLTSGVYLLDEGLVGPQEVKGVLAGTSVGQFLNNVNKADTGMVVKIYGPDNTELSAEDEITTGTNVWSKSANGLDSVNYVISSLGKLNSNCTLTSTKYEVITNVPTGKITNLRLGVTIAQVLANVSAPESANLSVTNGAEQIIPIFKYNNDTMLLKDKLTTLSLASPNTYIEVVAEDKVTKCIYALEFAEQEMPFVLSDVYVVDQEKRLINFADRTSPSTFLSNLIVSTGATAKIVNKLGQERTKGTVEYSDRIEVSKGEMTVSYLIEFSSQDGVWQSIQKQKQNTISIYPNPTSNFVTVNGLQGKTIQIRDLAGKLVSKRNVDAPTITLDIRSLSKGIYILSTEVNLRNYSFKIIKE